MVLGGLSLGVRLVTVTLDPWNVHYMVSKWPRACPFGLSMTLPPYIIMQSVSHPFKRSLLFTEDDTFIVVMHGAFSSSKSFGDNKLDGSAL